MKETYRGHGLTLTLSILLYIVLIFSQYCVLYIMYEAHQYTIIHQIYAYIIEKSNITISMFLYAKF